MRRFITIAFLAVLTFSCIQARGKDSYEIKRALDLIQDKEYDKAQEFLDKELKIHPQKAKAWAIQAYISQNNKDYGNALKSLDIMYKHQRKNKKNTSYYYALCAECYLLMNDTTRGLDHLNRAIAILPKDTDFLEKRAEVFLATGQYDKSYSDYMKILNMEKYDATLYIRLGDICQRQTRYQEGEEYLSQAIQLRPSSSEAYYLRGICHLHDGNIDKALDDAIQCLAIDEDNTDAPRFIINCATDTSFIKTCIKIRKQMLESPTKRLWTSILGDLYFQHGDYKQAIDTYQKAREIDDNSDTDYMLSACFDNIGELPDAMKYCNMVIEKDSSYALSYYLRSSIFYDLGEMDSSICAINKYIEIAPEDASGYYKLAFLNKFIGRYDDAVDKITDAITLTKDYAPYLMERGVIYEKMGKKDLALQDYASVIKTDTVLEKSSIRHFALLRSGREQEAVTWLNKMVVMFPGSGIYYDAACFYSIINDSKTAISYLKEALNNGYREFAHIRNDFDLDNIRKLPEFKELIRSFTTPVNKQQKKYDAPKIETTSIPMISVGGVYKVPCNVNGLNLDFIFDTGSSDISISSIEARFMLKNGYLTMNDLGGTSKYMTANGDIVNGTEVILSNMKIGNLILKKVKASVIDNQSAPLLLGQSVLSRLGKIEVDNNKKLINITYTK